MKKLFLAISLTVTSLLLCCSCSSKTDELESEIRDLKSQVSDLENQVSDLQTQVEYLNAQVEQQNNRLTDIELRQIFNW